MPSSGFLVANACAMSPTLPTGREKCLTPAASAAAPNGFE
jgi:hypothetical protein